jgi:hypothetical protein
MSRTNARRLHDSSARVGEDGILSLMSQLTLNLPDDVAKALADAGREVSRTPEEVAADMLRRMIAVRRFQQLSKEVREALGPNAPTSEEEIFEQIS